MTSYKGLTIRGYQSHVDSHIPLAPGLTVITGPSGHGKTAILRSIRWLAFGEPKGDDFLHTLRDGDGSIRSQAEQTQVILQRADDVTIEKVRRKKKTMHKVSTIETPFEKSDTPQEVKDLMGLRVYKFGDFDNALNFAYQLEAPFLLSESPSAGAKVLGKLAGTEAVDKAIKSVGKDTYAERQVRDAAEAEADTKTAELLSYLFLDDAIQAYDTCSQLMEMIEANVSAVDQLKELRNKYTAATEAAERHKAALEKYQNLDQARIMLGMASESATVLFKLDDLSGKYEAANVIVRYNTGQLKKLEGIEEAVEKLKKIQDAYHELKELENERELYTNNTQVVDKLKTDLERFKHLEAAEAVLQRLYNSEIDLQTLKDIRSSYDNTSKLHTDISAKIGLYADLGKANELIPKITDNYHSLGKLYKLSVNLNLANIGVENAEKWLTDHSKKVEEAQQELHDAWKAAGDICPLCEQPLGGAHEH